MMYFLQHWKEKQMNTNSQFQYTANTSNVAKLFTLLKSEYFCLYFVMYSPRLNKFSNEEVVDLHQICIICYT